MTSSHKIKINTGLSEAHRHQVAEGLSRFLADSYALYLKTHHFHWNVTGPHFKSLHELFEVQYTELFAAVDLIAERIRALGEFAPGSFKAFQALTSLKDTVGVPAWDAMIQELLEGQETVIRAARGLLALAQTASDEVTLSLLTDRMEAHEKSAWMLRSFLA